MVSKVVLLIFTTTVLVMSLFHVFSEYNHIFVEKNLAKNAELITEKKLKRLETSAIKAERLYPFRGGMNKAYTAVLYWKRIRSKVKHEIEKIGTQIIAEQEKDIVSARNKGTAWAALAQNLAYAGKRDAEYRYARNSALVYGKYEYDAVRMILSMGISDWPNLRCQEKIQILGVVDYAKKLDDSIIVFRNLKQGNSGLKDHLEKLYKSYKFNYAWARHEVNRCQ